MALRWSLVIALSIWGGLVLVGPAAAHPAPFSYLDVLVDSDSLRLRLIVHTFDIAHELKIEPPEQVLRDEILRPRGAEFARIIAERLSLRVDGVSVSRPQWSPPDALPERQSVGLEARIDLRQAPSRVQVHAHLFPYDKVHQTFVNVYEGEQLRTQAILDLRRQDLEYFSGSPRGVLALGGRFVSLGATHVLFGLDHLVFLVGLLLLGGTTRKRLLVVSAFTLTHVVTLALAAFHVVRPPSRLVDQAIALSIVYAGADNLMVRGGRDVRGWIAAALGAIHGLGYASALHSLDLSRVALGWSVAWFNVGVGLGHVTAVTAIGTLLGAVQSHNEVIGRRVAYAGSVAVIAAGTFWFVQRVFFPGGLA